MRTADLVKKYRHIFNTDYTADANCKGAWLFTEGSGTTVADATGNGNTGTFLGSGQPTWSVSVPSYHTLGSSAGSVDYDSDYIDVTTSTSLDGITGTNLSLVCWAYFDANGSWQALINRGDSTYNHNYWLGKAESNGIHFRLINSEDTSITTTETVGTGVWYFIVATYDGTTMRVYIDGTISVTTGSHTASLRADNDLSFGSNFSNEKDWLNGKLTDVAIFGDVLDSTEINEIYDYGLKGASGVTKKYTKQILASLPSDNSDLSTEFTTQEYTDVSTDDGTYVILE